MNQRKCKYCENICLRISRAVAVTKLCTLLWNARIFTELQPVQNLRIFSNNLIMFKIDLRKLWSQRPLWSFRQAHRRAAWTLTCGIYGTVWMRCERVIGRWQRGCGECCLVFSFVWSWLWSVYGVFFPDLAVLCWTPPPSWHSEVLTFFVIGWPCLCFKTN